MGEFRRQQKTVLGVRGEQDLIAAIETCWASLHNERAVAYREANDVAEARMAVVVQRMIEPRAAGVLFTANPLTGRRTEMVVDAAPGLGTAVVDGTAEADHYVIGEQPPLRAGGCLSRGDLHLLRDAGRRVQHHFGSPQDIEWALDAHGTLWLLQSRAVTSLFPLPETDDGELHVYMEAGHMQGMLRPMTPMGQSAMGQITRQWFEAFGAKPGTGSNVVTWIGGRMFIDLTPMVANRRLRGRLPEMLEQYGPRVARSMEQVVADPRFTRRRMRIPLGAIARITVRMAPTMLRGGIAALRRPDAERRRILASAAQVRADSEVPADVTTAQARLDAAERVHLGMLSGPMLDALNPLWTAMLCQALATRMLKGIASESEVAGVVRGAPHNVTTEMNLKLWRIAADAGEHRQLLAEASPEELAERYRDGSLPDIGLREFLDEYGHRAAAEIDVGVPRWEEDPAPIFDVLSGYVQLTDPDQAPDERFRRAAEEAEATIDDLVARARRRGRLRSKMIAFLLRRARKLIGLREFPKFIWLFALRQVRRQLLAVGGILADRGVIDTADDVMFLDLDEVRAAVRSLGTAAGNDPGDGDGAPVREPDKAPGGGDRVAVPSIDTAPENDVDLRALVAERRAIYRRELRRRHVPALMLSDGTDVEATLPAPDVTDGLIGTGAAPGTATGRARVISDPRGARIEPGEILIAPTTDPGWTPLFMTAAGLVTETGAAMAHGPTVAREYGIPAVICVRDATTEITTGQLISIDGSSGVVRFAGEGEG